ncbi:uncharacterized protein [Diadema antillarum]|uniref:uncharacterized protein n=1 Tax=Diadema antillarum TaxID=105358 RepID=UPI003A88DC54
MTVKCYDEMPSVQLVNGASPLEGLVFLESGSYACYEGFTAKAAELVCGELGFPAAEEYSPEPTPSLATRTRTQRVSCSSQDSYRFQRLRDCPTPECSSNMVVRVKCRGPGFLGCYQGDHKALSILLDYASESKSDEKCISTCRKKPRNNGVAVIHLGFCVCFQSKSYADFISDGSFSNNWTCPSQAQPISEERVHYSFNTSVGYCDYPSPVTNGQWITNNTKYGSNITLSCGGGYVINDSATLQCKEVPGWSTYFPQWNPPFASCRAVANESNDTGVYTVSTSSSTAETVVNTFSERLSTQEVSTFHEASTMLASRRRQSTQGLTTGEPTSSLSKRGSTQDLTTRESTSPLNSGGPGVTLIAYALGVFVGVVLIVLAVLSLLWRNRRRKRQRRTSRLPNQANNYSDDGQLQIYPVSTAIQNASMTNDVDLLDYSSIDAATMGHPIPRRSGNIFGDVIDHQEDPYHIYQDTEEVRNGPSRITGVHPNSSSISVGSNMGSATMSSMTAVNSSGYHGYQCLQETSLDQPASVYEDCDYQDVDLDNRKDSMTKDDFKSTARACLFDDSCYNSLDFGERSDRVFAQASNVCMDSEYGCIKHVTHDDDKQIHDPLPSTTGSTSGRADSMSCSGLSSAKIVPSEDPLNKVDCEKSHDVDLTYSLIKKDETHDEETVVSLKPGPKPCEELHATVNQAAKTPSSIEELYATVDKAAKTPSSIKELYATVDKAAKTPSSTEELYATVDKAAKTPSSIEELYAKVDKTRGDHDEVTQPSQEELYMNVTNM